jgi:hypothetical protein
MEPKKVRERGRPAIGEGVKLGLRIRPDLDHEIERWILGKGDPKLSKPEAIRQLLWKALKG